jgi:hypothetical protein
MPADPVSARKWCESVLDASRPIYEDRHIAESAGHHTAALAAAGQRARRLLAAIVVLFDAGHGTEASGLFRGLIESHITVSWISLAPADNLLVWELEDIRGRLNSADGIRRQSNGEDPLSHNHRRYLEDRKVEIRRELRRRRVSPAYPKIDRQAQLTGSNMAYDVAYRYESQVRRSSSDDRPRPLHDAL